MARMAKKRKKASKKTTVVTKADKKRAIRAIWRKREVRGERSEPQSGTEFSGPRRS